MKPRHASLLAAKKQTWPGFDWSRVVVVMIAPRPCALAEAAPGSNIDREDVAYELADIGLGFDSDATKTLLDAFDEGDGMIPINHFLDAALAQVAE